ncbi:MAG TPA: photosystem reaction center subunit H [Syntrophaceticus sp.]|nr:PRC-barrel domain-containing protein [Syntrophaceticus schinkii]MDD4260905.1 PRC-barrel domain-containing protein [Syntrophaceticus schinkii]MDD4675645.1 PRC-barrel domain-containing protein [Syntrophaceticus schinkii]HHY29674.1 photosystem reaction center subunit H [Syntrophaceticus sp.]
MRRSRQFLSLPVITLEEGKQIGRIRGLVVNHQTGEVAALLVQRGNIFREQKVIPYPRVVSVGNSALTIQKASSAERIASLPQILTLVKDNIQLKGSRVITENGTALGHVVEYMIDPATGKIKAFEISGNPAESLWKGKSFLPADEVRTIGKDVLVVRQGAEETLKRDDGKLAEGVKNIKDTTNRFVNKARQLHSKMQGDEPEETLPEEEKEDTPPGKEPD